MAISPNGCLKSQPVSTLGTSAPGSGNDSGQGLLRWLVPGAPYSFFNDPGNNDCPSPSMTTTGVP